MTDEQEQPEDEPLERSRAAVRFASDRLGPSSTALLADPEVMAVVLSRMRAGVEPEDAVLAEVHARAERRPELANEFLAFFLTDLLRTGRPMISAGLHRFLDTWDLAQSVLGDLWPQLSSLKFENRARFISLLAQRLSWKSTGRARELARGKRREDLRAPQPPEELDLRHAGHSPISLAGFEEERERLVLILMRLSERDRALLRMHLKGDSLEVIMEATGLGYEAARKALRRAITRAQQFATRDGDDES